MIAAEDKSVLEHDTTKSVAADCVPRTIGPMPEYDTRTLFDGGREIVIRHAGAAYRMKITKQGKLILNK
nr:hemin uptake protein HemP [uncultured Rhizobium sp.]